MLSFDDLHNLSLKKQAINLTGGNPVSAGADFVKEAMEEAILSPEMGRYPAVSGEPAVKNTLYRYAAAARADGGLGLHGKRYSAGSVVLGCGITQLWAAYASYIKSLSAARNAARRAAGEAERAPVVVMPEQTYGLCTHVLRSYGIQVYGIPLSTQKRHKLQAQDVRQTIDAIEEDGSREVLCLKVDNPSNPTGAVLQRADVEQIATLCVSRKIHIFDDLAYFGLENNEQAFPFAGLPPSGKNSDLHEYVFTACNLSKAGAFPAARAGFGIGSAQIVSKVSEYIANTTAALSYPAQAAIATFFDVKNAQKRQDFLASQRQEYALRGKMMAACINGAAAENLSAAEQKQLHQAVEALDEARYPGLKKDVREMLRTGIEGISILNPNPEAGFFYLIRFDSFKGDDVALARKILEHGGPFVLTDSFLMVPRFNQAHEAPQKPCARITFSFEKLPVILLSMHTLRKSLQSIAREENQRGAAAFLKARAGQAI